MSAATSIPPAVTFPAQVLRERLEGIAREFRTVALASSLGPEDMLLTDAILRARLPIHIFTLDTGRLHPETLALLGRVRERYGYEIEVFHPAEAQVERYVSEHGLNAFYESLELRQRCCHIRKVEPLARALTGRQAWITGQRREQSAARAAVQLRQIDEAHALVKFNPLVDWTAAEVWAYLRAHGVPYNPLHDRGYPSIGCEPCTRAVRPGEDPRAGRWWWETRNNKECGLHLAPRQVTEGAGS